MQPILFKVGVDIGVLVAMTMAGNTVLAIQVSVGNTDKSFIHYRAGSHIKAFGFGRRIGEMILAVRVVGSGLVLLMGLPFGGTGNFIVIGFAPKTVEM